MSKPTPAPMTPLSYSNLGSSSAASRRKLEWALLSGGLAFLLIVIPTLYGTNVMSITTVNQLGRFLCFAIAAIGVDLIWGYCGILSLCQAMFFCFGGYAIGMHMALHAQLNAEGVPQILVNVSSEVGQISLPWFWKPFSSLGMALLLGVAIPGLAAYIFGYLAFRSRVRGVYFSIITQATVLAGCLVFRRNETLLCGTNGLNAFKTLAGFDIYAPSTRIGMYILTVVMLAIVFLSCRYLSASRLGRLMLAVRDNEPRLRFAGYQPVFVKVFVFTLAAVIAGIGGMLYTPQNEFIEPSVMEPVQSIMMVLWVAVGGRGLLTGAVLGTLIVKYAESFLTTKFATAWPLFQGGLFLAVVLFMPNGVIGALKDLTASRTSPTPTGDDDEMPESTLAVSGGKA